MEDETELSFAPCADIFLRRDGAELFPQDLPMEILLYMQRAMSRIQHGPDDVRLQPIYDLLSLWISKLIQSTEHRPEMTSREVVEQFSGQISLLEYGVQQELIARLTGERIFMLDVEQLKKAEYFYRAAKRVRSAVGLD